MWVNEQAVETTASPEAVWALWADVPGWPRWNGNIEQIGPAGDTIGPAIGPEISGDFPETLAALVALAEDA